MIWMMKVNRRILQHCKNLYILKILLKLIIVSICAKMKLSKFWHFNFRVVDSWYNIKFFVTILGLNHWNVSILLGFWQFQKVLDFQLLMNVNVPILCTISLFLVGFSSLDKSPSLTSPSFVFSFFWMRGRLIQFANKLIKTTQIYYKHQHSFHCNIVISCKYNTVMEMLIVWYFKYSEFFSPLVHLDPAKQNNRLSSPPAVGVGSGHSNIWTLCRPICLISFGNQTHFAVIKVRENSSFWLVDFIHLGFLLVNVLKNNTI